MRDSTDNTVFGVAPLKWTLPVVGAALVLLFVAIRPEASSGLGLFERFGFWSAHVGIGLAGLVVASLLIRRSLFIRLPLSLSIIATGIVGVIATAPAYWLMDRWLPVPGAAVPDGWLDTFAMEGTWQGVIAECLEVAPLFVASWFVINLPLIFSPSRPDEREPPPDPDAPAAPRSGPTPKGVETGPADGFLDRLPAVLGRDLVAISSDLHYLHVYTTLGKTMLIGSLSDTVRALGPLGMRVHRSHWVAHAHVVRLHIAGKEALCVMSDGLRVPVSRRRRAEVKAQYGQGIAVKRKPCSAA
ncbi:MAG: LytTR family DNA-binding domain-containing protein [Chromatiales bacterium]|jgi:hypothetical protein